MNSLLTRFRLLPLLVLVAILAFGVRVGETITDARDLTASALAEEKPAAKADADKPAEPAKAADAKPAVKANDVSDEQKADALPPAPGEAQPSTQKQPAVSLPDSTLPEVWADPSQQDMADSPEQMKLLQDLAKRRAQLDAKAKALDTREALMKASEKQIDGKINEMTQLKDQMEKLLGQQQTEQNAKTQSLVKIYEGMKPKEAATIFNQMDMSVLLQVISNMSERKSAPIIAVMDTAKANELTVRLSEMKKLPEEQTGFKGTNTTGAAPASTGPAPTAAPAGSAALPGLDALGKQ